MGKGDRRKSNKMLQRKSRAKFKERQLRPRILVPATPAVRPVLKKVVQDEEPVEQSADAPVEAEAAAL